MSNSSNNFDLEQDYTYKQFYYPASDGEAEEQQPQKRKIISQDIDAFFDNKPKKKKRNCSTVGQSCKSGGFSYISTSRENPMHTHLIKIELYDLKKLSRVSDEKELWKHADVRVKYYVNDNDQKSQYQQAKEVIYKITKEIAESEECKKYHFNS